jgi:hypothetical protein
VKNLLDASYDGPTSNSINNRVDGCEGEFCSYLDRMESEGTPKPLSKCSARKDTFDL